MITVAIPAFKGRFLSEAIQSVLSQTYSDFELIVVNDASPENLPAIVDRFNDSRIKYFHKPVNPKRTSVVDNWNECLRHATGDLFVLFSDDDIYEPTFLDEMVLLSTNYPKTDVFHCRVRVIDEQGQTIDYIPACPEHESAISFIWHRTKDHRMHFAPEFLCRTAALKKVGGFVDLPQAWGADDATWCLLARAGGVGYSQKALCNWRKSTINISRIGDTASRFEALNGYQRIVGESIAQWECITREDRDMLSGALKELPRWVASHKSDLLLAGAERRTFSTTVRATLRWLAYRKKYNLSWRVYMKALSEAARKAVGHRSD